MHEVFRSLLKIFEYAAKQACNQLQCNKAKLSEPASINGLHKHRALSYASLTNDLLCTLFENIGGHIYTVTPIQCFFDSFYHFHHLVCQERPWYSDQGAGLAPSKPAFKSCWPSGVTCSLAGPQESPVVLLALRSHL